jgi:GTPase SAR1 family protein/uncharacterized DUF497 family protein
MELPEENTHHVHIDIIIETLNNDQIVFFTWLFSMRVLPFLGLTGSFNFWKNKVNGPLYTIFNTLDIVIAANYYDNIISNTTLDALDAVLAAVDTRAVRAARVVRAAVLAARTARVARASRDAFALDALDDAIDARAVAIDAILAALTTLTAARGDSQQINKLYNIILEDIFYIKEGIFDKFNNDIGLYGNIWNNFQKALNDVGCGYWGRLYENIFRSGFKVDKKALKMRLSVPQEIKNEGAKAVADNLELMESEGSENLNEARIIILGEKGAGKTCLARRLIDPEAPMTEPNESTEGVVSTIWKIESKGEALAVNTHIWDFAGHVITHAAHRCFLSERCLYILVYDGRSERRNQIEYWLDHVKNYGGNAPVIILINMFDDHIPDIPKNTLRQKYPFIKDFVCFSIKKDKVTLRKFSAATSELILNNLIWNSQNMPLSYYKVKDALRELFDKEIEYIPKEYFYEKAFENGVTDREKQDILLEYLHWLGICLWYKDIEEFDTLVLNPDWITNGIYKVINWAHNKSRYNQSKSTISIDDFEIIFNDVKELYPKDKINFILKLMERYELAYSKDSENITVPHVLRDDQPDELPDFPIQESLMLKYIFQQPLPPNTVCRLIVRHHDEIENDSDVWRYGVVLKYKKETIALVYEDDRNIIITVKGKDKSEYISKLRETMNEILRSYKSSKPDLQYRILSNEQNEVKPGENEETLLPYGIIKSYVNKKRSYLTENQLDIPYEVLAEMAKLYKMEEIHIGDNYFFHGDGAQANFSKDKSFIQAIQNNDIDPRKLNELIENLKKAFPKNASENDKEVFNDSIVTISEEANKPEPRKNIIRTALNSLKGIKGTTEFAAAVAAIVQFFIWLLKN